MLENMMTVKETAQALKVAESTIRNMVRCDELPHIRIGKRIVINKEQLELWLVSRTHNLITKGEQT